MAPPAEGAEDPACLRRELNHLLDKYNVGGRGKSGAAHSPQPPPKSGPPPHAGLGPALPQQGARSPSPFQPRKPPLSNTPSGAESTRCDRGVASNHAITFVDTFGACRSSRTSPPRAVPAAGVDGEDDSDRAAFEGLLLKYNVGPQRVQSDMPQSEGQHSRAPSPGQRHVSLEANESPRIRSRHLDDDDGGWGLRRVVRGESGSGTSLGGCSRQQSQSRSASPMGFRRAAFRPTADEKEDTISGAAFPCWGLRRLSGRVGHAGDSDSDSDYAEAAHRSLKQGERRAWHPVAAEASTKRRANFWSGLDDGLHQEPSGLPGSPHGRSVRSDRSRRHDDAALHVQQHFLERDVGSEPQKAVTRAGAFRVQPISEWMQQRGLDVEYAVDERHNSPPAQMASEAELRRLAGTSRLSDFLVLGSCGSEETASQAPSHNPAQQSRRSSPPRRFMPTHAPRVQATEDVQSNGHGPPAQKRPVVYLPDRPPLGRELDGSLEAKLKMLDEERLRLQQLRERWRPTIVAIQSSH